MDRISRDAMFLDMANIVAMRGTCPRANVGALITRGGRVISMGYNGAPPGMPHCYEVGCTPAFKEEPQSILHTLVGCERAIHAEANSIAWAARSGVPTGGATMYSTHLACIKCAELLLSAGIMRFVYSHDYRIKDGLLLLEAANVEIQWNLQETNSAA